MDVSRKNKRHLTCIPEGGGVEAGKGAQKPFTWLIIDVRILATPWDRGPEQFV
jgi:hypothetical protein